MAAKMAAKMVKLYKMAYGIFKKYQMGAIVIVMWLSSHKEGIPIPKTLHMYQKSKMAAKMAAKICQIA